MTDKMSFSFSWFATISLFIVVVVAVVVVVVAFVVVVIIAVVVVSLFLFSPFLSSFIPNIPPLPPPSTSITNFSITQTIHVLHKLAALFVVKEGESIHRTG